MSHHFVNAIIQDKEGFIWIGTNYGLNRFDEHEFKLYTIANKLTQQTNIVGIYTGFKDYLMLRYNQHKGDAYIFFDPKTKQQLSQQEAFGSLPTRLDGIENPNINKEFLNYQRTPTILNDGNIVMRSSDPHMLYLYRTNKETWNSIYYELTPDEAIYNIFSIDTYTALRIVKSDTINPSISNRILVIDENYKVLYSTPSYTDKLLATNTGKDTLFFIEEIVFNKKHVFHYQLPNQAPVALDTLDFINGGLAYITGESLYNIFFENSRRLDIRDYKGSIVQSINISGLGQQEAIANLNTALIDKDWGIWVADYNQLPFAYLKLLNNRFKRYLHNIRKQEGNLSLPDYQSTRGIAVYQDSLLFVNSINNTYKLNLRNQQIEQEVVERTAQIQEQAEKLKAIDRVKSRFFANISHELRTPLTLILGPLSYTLENPIVNQHQEIQQQLLTMQKNGKNLLQLVEEILDLSKLEANKLEVNEEPTPIVQFVERIFTIFEPQFQSQQLDYELKVQLQDENLYVLLDRNKVEKVLNNFLSNSMKFTPDTGP